MSERCTGVRCWAEAIPARVSELTGLPSWAAVLLLLVVWFVELCALYAAYKLFLKNKEKIKLLGENFWDLALRCRILTVPIFAAAWFGVVLLFWDTVCTYTTGVCNGQT